MAEQQLQAMEFVLSGPRIRTFARTLSCLAKIGSELLFQVEADELTFRTFNSSKTSYLAITFRPAFFDVFSTQGCTAKTTVFLKSVCTVFRTPASYMETLSIILSQDPAAKMQWRIDLANGVRKSYSISSSDDCDLLNVLVDRSTLPSRLVVKPKDLNKILSNFQATLGEITVVATEPGSTPPSTADVAQKSVLFRSYIDPAKDPGTDDTMHTALWLDPGEELQAYHHSGPPVDVTISVKDLRAFTAFCEGAEADVEMMFLRASKPVRFEPRFNPSDYAHAHMEATLVLSTIPGSQLAPNAMHPINLGPAFGTANQPREAEEGRRSAAAEAAAAGPSGAQEGAGHASHFSSRLWSDLSGGAGTGINQGRASSEQTGNHGVGPSGTASEEIHLPRRGSKRPPVPSAAEPSRPPPQARGTHTYARVEEDPSEPDWVPPPAPHDPMAWEPAPHAQAARAAQPALVQPSGNPNVWLENTEEDEEDEYCVPSTPEDRRGQLS